MSKRKWKTTQKTEKFNLKSLTKNRKFFWTRSPGKRKRSETGAKRRKRRWKRRRKKENQIFNFDNFTRSDINRGTRQKLGERGKVGKSGWKWVDRIPTGEGKPIQNVSISSWVRREKGYWRYWTRKIYALFQSPSVADNLNKQLGNLVISFDCILRNFYKPRPKMQNLLSNGWR